MKEFTTWKRNKTVSSIENNVSRALWQGTSNAFRKSQVVLESSIYLSVHGISFWILKSGQKPDPKGPCMYNNWKVWTFLWDAEHRRIWSRVLEAFHDLVLTSLFQTFLLDWQFMLQEHEKVCTPSLPHPSNIAVLLFPALFLCLWGSHFPLFTSTPQDPQGPLSAGYYSSCSPEVTTSRKSSWVLSSLTLRQSFEFTFNECPPCVKHPGVYFMSIIWCNPQNSIK